ncbi:hypothetical protein EV426DRAFT_388325 [Tirmania nivea]|nr:hypothetical protein EV426DRAFT_388325 [Tirmania nivea]
MEDTERTTATRNMVAEWMSRSWKVMQVRSQVSTELGLDSIPSIPASARLRDVMDGASENTTTVTAEEDFATEYARSWRTIESDSDASVSEDLDFEVVDGSDHDYMGTVTVLGEDTIYQFSSATSSLTDLGELPEIHTPEPFIARRKRMQVTHAHISHAQMLYGDNVLRMNARLVSPWDFRIQSSSRGDSRDAHRKAAVDMGLFPEVRGGEGDGEEAVGKDEDGGEKRELTPPPFMTGGYAEGADGSWVVVVSSPGSEEIREKMAFSVGGELRRSGVEADFAMNCASRGGRMPEEMVLRSLTTLVGWS